MPLIKWFMLGNQRRYCYKYYAPSIGCEDVTCERTVLTSSCIQEREHLLLEVMYSSKDASVSDDCWSAFKCLLDFPESDFFFCEERCQENACVKIVENNCSSALYFPQWSRLFRRDLFRVQNK